MLKVSHSHGHPKPLTRVFNDNLWGKVRSNLSAHIGSATLEDKIQIETENTSVLQSYFYIFRFRVFEARNSSWGTIKQTPSRTSIQKGLSQIYPGPHPCRGQQDFIILLELFTYAAVTNYHQLSGLK